MPELNESEKQYLSLEDAHKYTRADTILSDKLLYCLLEAMKEIKEEIQQLRQSNRNLERMLQGTLSTWHGKPVIQVYNSNV